jgi:predicted nucleic acid-binding protein
LTSPLLLFDASSIFTLVRELRGKALDMLWESSTVSLAYYEVGNAVWRECFMLKRITPKEATKLLKSIFAMLRAMDVAVVEDEELGTAILNITGRLNITYYDAAYLIEAQRLDKTLVTDDEKLTRAAKSVGVKTMTSRTLCH